MKLTRFEIFVAAAGVLVDTPRLVDVGLGLHGIRWSDAAKYRDWAETWGTIHGVTSGAFGLVLAAAVIMAFSALVTGSHTAPGARFLAVTTGVMLVTTVTAVTATLSGVSHWIVTLCAVVAPMLVTVTVPLAAAIRDRDNITQRVTRTESVSMTVEGPITPALASNAGQGEAIGVLEAPTLRPRLGSPVAVNSEALAPKALTATERKRRSRAAKRVSVTA